MSCGRPQQRSHCCRGAGILYGGKGRGGVRGNSSLEQRSRKRPVLFIGQAVAVEVRRVAARNEPAGHDSTKACVSSSCRCSCGTSPSPSDACRAERGGACCQQSGRLAAAVLRLQQQVLAGGGRPCCLPSKPLPEAVTRRLSRPTRYAPPEAAQARQSSWWWWEICGCVVPVP